MGELLKQRRAELIAESKGARAFLEELTDAKSFVELDAYRYSTAPLFEEAGLKGEGVLTGYARLDDAPIYLAVQNHDQIKGGLTKEQCRKIVKAMEMAEKAECPFLFVLESSGVKVGEGLPVLDGFAEVLKKASALYGVIPLYAVVKGEVYGLTAYLTAQCDAVIAMKGALMASASPDVILSRSSSSLSKEQAFGAQALLERGAADLVAESPAQAKAMLSRLISFVNEPIAEEDEISLNRDCASLTDTSALVQEVFDQDSVLELGSGKGVHTVLGRIGGFAVGALITENATVCPKCARRAARFVRMLEATEMPLVVFTDCTGAKTELCAEDKGLIAEVSNLMSAIADHECAKISVACGNAQGLGYAALASKGLGYDYAMSWDTASLSVLSGEQGATLIYSEEIAKAENPQAAREKLAEKYRKVEGDPFTAAYKGCVDAVIEPQATRRQVIAALMMLLA